MILCGLAIFLAQLAWPARLGLAGVALHLLWQVATVNPADPAGCLARFQANRHLGWILLAGLFAGRALA